MIKKVDCDALLKAVDVGEDEPRDYGVETCSLYLEPMVRDYLTRNRLHHLDTQEGAFSLVD